MPRPARRTASPASCHNSSTTNLAQSKSHVKLRPYELLEYIFSTAKQKHWELSSQLIESFGLSSQDMSMVRYGINLKNDRAAGEIWATTYIIAYLHANLLMYQEDWNRTAEEAKKWLQNQELFIADTTHIFVTHIAKLLKMDKEDLLENAFAETESRKVSVLIQENDINMYEANVKNSNTEATDKQKGSLVKHCHRCILSSQYVPATIYCSLCAKPYYCNACCDKYHSTSYQLGKHIPAGLRYMELHGKFGFPSTDNE